MVDGDPASAASKRLIRPELLPLLEAFAAFDPQAMPVEQVRASRAASAQPPRLDRPEVELRRLEIDRPGSGGSLGLFFYLPRSAAGPLPVLLHMHGGGYIFGSAAHSDSANAGLAVEAQCAGASVDYRLAPEAPFPGAIEDCFLALSWLAEHHQALGVDPARIALGGESAGGGLAAALALLARERGGVQPVFQWLIYPMIDDRTGAAGEPHSFAGRQVWTAQANRFAWAALLGAAPGGEGVSPFAAAARAQDLSGLPPAYIAVGALDLFAEEDIDYARRLMRAGVPVDLCVLAGACHGFDLIGDSEIGRRFTHAARSALRRALHGET